MQGQVWPLAGAEVGERVYNDQVSLERTNDGKTWYMRAIPGGSSQNVPQIVYGPFRLRGFGPYSMLITKIWLNTDDSEKYVSITFHDSSSARKFYRVLNPHHSPMFVST